MATEKLIISQCTGRARELKYVKLFKQSGGNL